LNFICKRCNEKFHIEINRKSICKECNIQLDLLDEEKRVNDQRIRKLEEHKKIEMENPTSKETMSRIEHNLEIEYEKRDGIMKTMKSKDKF
jgi:hypothetical protein